MSPVNFVTRAFSFPKQTKMHRELTLFHGVVSYRSFVTLLPVLLSFMVSDVLSISAVSRENLINANLVPRAWERG